jgi:hypothetical protein
MALYRGWLICQDYSQSDDAYSLKPLYTRATDKEQALQELHSDADEATDIIGWNNAIFLTEKEMRTLKKAVDDYPLLVGDEVVSTDF